MQPLKLHAAHGHLVWAGMGTSDTLALVHDAAHGNGEASDASVRP